MKNIYQGTKTTVANDTVCSCLVRQQYVKLGTDSGTWFLLAVLSVQGPVRQPRAGLQVPSGREHRLERRVRRTISGSQGSVANGTQQQQQCYRS